MLADAEDARLVSGTNLALVGEELVQFGRAEQLGSGRWRLRRLLRGRRGTETAAGMQQPGDRFVLLDPDSVRTLAVPLASLHSEIRVMATGTGDAGGPADARLMVRGASVVPPSPVHLGWTSTADGGARVCWTRRSRGGWRWSDGVDAPLGEEREAYRVVRTGSDGSVVAADVNTPACTVDAASLAAGPVLVSVSQRGTFGESAPATIEIGRITA